MLFLANKSICATHGMGSYTLEDLMKDTNSVIRFFCKIYLPLKVIIQINKSTNIILLQVVIPRNDYVFKFYWKSSIPSGIHFIYDHFEIILYTLVKISSKSVDKWWSSYVIKLKNKNAIKSTLNCIVNTINRAYELR